MEYAIVIEGDEGDYSAYAPDVPGCGAAGESIEEVITLLREALEGHFALLAASGEPLPVPATRVATVAITLPTAA